MKRVKKQLDAVMPNRGKINERNTEWTGVTAYITNISEDVVTTKQAHDIYSLRCQIEIMSKVWKSIFNIAKVRNVKLEQFKCFLYGRLLSLLLASQIVFTSKDIIYEENNKDVSILIKSFSLVNEYFITLKTDIFRNKFKKILFLNNILDTMRKLGIKCKKNSLFFDRGFFNKLYITSNLISSYIFIFLLKY